MFLNEVLSIVLSGSNYTYYKMPVLDVVNNNAIPETAEESSSAPINPVVGIIYPPPEVRSILRRSVLVVNSFKFDIVLDSNLKLCF